MSSRAPGKVSSRCLRPAVVHENVHRLLREARHADDPVALSLALSLTRALGAGPSRVDVAAVDQRTTQVHPDRQRLEHQALHEQRTLIEEHGRFQCATPATLAPARQQAITAGAE